MAILGCSHTVKQQGLESCEPDCPEDWPAPDAAGGKLPIHLRDGAADVRMPDDAGFEADSPADHRRVGDACYLTHSPGTVCMRDDGSLGCSTWPTRCEPFEDAGS